MRRVRVAIYGGGIAGLSAAHELAKRGSEFDVHVYEPSDRVGGKARSQYLPWASPDGRSVALPGEHGFRFFPAFYFHLDQTMAEIPLSRGRSVLDNLVPSWKFAVARNGREPVPAPRRVARSATGVSEVMSMLSTWFSQGGLGLSAADLANMVHAFSKFMMSAETRRARQFDHMSWYEFTNCQSSMLSDQYRTLSTTLPRTLVAMDGRHGSAYTLGKILCQIAFLDPLRVKASADRVLNGPTDDVWLSPWYEHLVSQGVRFHFGTALERLDLDDERSVGTAHLSNGRMVHADYHICAMPIDRLSAIIDDGLAAASKSLADARRELGNSQDWMVGAQYFLKRSYPVADGHVIYTDSPWALTSISQEQFWERRHVNGLNDGGIQGVLSVDISNWSEVAPRLGRPANACTREEILDEVFRQIMDALSSGDADPLGWDDVVARHLDENIRFDGHGGTASANDTPLFVHRPGAYEHRPTADTEIENLFVTADHVATHTNLACMEGANEAARRAVRSILRKEGRTTRLPAVRELAEPLALRPLRRFDAWLMSKHPDAPHVLEMEEAQLSELLAEADRVSSQVSLPTMRAWVRQRTPFPRPSSAPHWLRRAVRHDDKLGSAMRRAERLASRRSLLGRPRHRTQPTPMARPPASSSATRLSDPPPEC